MKNIFVIKIGVIAFVAVMLGFFLGTSYPSHEMVFSDTNMDKKRVDFISHKVAITEEMMKHSKYRCCLEKPCTYCIEKTPAHGEGAVCNCLEDVVSGMHPCGECIGEILEGHGNRYLRKYFASSIAENVGIQHLDTMREIIEDKYGIPVEAQY